MWFGHVGIESGSILYFDDSVWCVQSLWNYLNGIFAYAWIKPWQNHLAHAKCPHAFITSHHAPPCHVIACNTQSMIHLLMLHHATTTTMISNVLLRSLVLGWSCVRICFRHVIYHVCNMLFFLLHVFLFVVMSFSEINMLHCAFIVSGLQWWVNVRWELWVAWNQYTFGSS